jgi:probable selenate reductase FAD-binding subunit
MNNFDYAKPSTIEEAVSLYKKYGEKARLLLGGTDLVVLMDAGAIVPDILIDLKGIEELKRLELDESFLHIGARVTFNELIDSPTVKEKFPLLWEASRTIASTGVRNRATLVGNICSAVPSADSAPALLVCDAVVVIAGEEGDKEVPITEFFTGPRKTVLKPGEIVKEVKIHYGNEKFGGSYIKLGRYDGEDLAQVGVATLIGEDKDYKIAFCAVAPKPVRATEAENYLKGKDLTEEVLEEATNLALKAISPISDIRASKEYRLYVSGVLVKRSLKTSLARMNGNGPAYGERLV